MQIGFGVFLKSAIANAVTQHMRESPRKAYRLRNARMHAYNVHTSRHFIRLLNWQFLKLNNARALRNSNKHKQLANREHIKHTEASLKKKRWTVRQGGRVGGVGGVYASSHHAPQHAYAHFPEYPLQFEAEVHTHRQIQNKRALAR